MKLIFFLLSNFTGFLITGGVTIYALHNTGIVDLPLELREQVWPYIVPGVMVSWIISSIISILYLFIKSSVRNLFLLFPIITPVIYFLYIINSFNL